ncbi:MAG: inner membrane-spanning protein YciB [Pseudomonadota bacterium]
MNPLLKLALEMGPLAVFFIAFNFLKADEGGGAQIDALIGATIAFMIALTIATAIIYAATKTISKITVVTFAIVVVMGGLTIWLRDETFIQYRPTVVNGLLAAVLIFGLLQGESYLKLVLGELLPMEDEGWRKVTQNWTMFFAGMALLNVAVVETQDIETWVWVKTFVYLPITLVFAFSQTPLMARYAIEEGEDGGPAST